MAPAPYETLDNAEFTESDNNTTMRKNASPATRSAFVLGMAATLLAIGYFLGASSSPALTAATANTTKPSFYEIASAEGTDKVSTHRYDPMYEKYLGPLRDKRFKMLEIGLGCNMDYGPGKSLYTWLKYVPNVELHYMEYDAACADKWRSSTPATIHSGDQANKNDLHRVIRDSGGDFDIIIDDGGHTMHQQITSFDVLFPEALKPGGIYICEDLQTSYWPSWGGTGPNTMMEMIKHMIDDLNAFTSGRKWKFPITKDILSIDCMEEVCAFTKRSEKRRPFTDVPH